MKRIFLLSLVLFAWQNQSAVCVSVGAFERQVAEDTAVGEVVRVDKDARVITIKTDQRETLNARVDDSTSLLRLPIGEMTLAKAEPIQFTAIGVGDRVLGRGVLSDDKLQFRAQQMIFVIKAEIEKKKENDLEVWRQRSISGLVKTIDERTREINLETTSLSRPRSVVIVANNCPLLRYSSWSTKFVDAKPVNFSELKAGDQLRVLGDWSGDGKRFDAQQVVAGSFQSFVGVVSRIDLLKGEIAAKALDRKQTVAVSLAKDSIIFRLPPELAVVIANAMSGQDPPKTTPAAQDLSKRREVGAVIADRPLNIERLLDDLPKLNATNLKPGDVIAVVGIASSDKRHMTAIKVVIGADALLNKTPSNKRQTLALSAGLPTTVFDFSLGPP